MSFGMRALLTAAQLTDYGNLLWDNPLAHHDVGKGVKLSWGSLSNHGVC